MRRFLPALVVVGIGLCGGVAAAAFHATTSNSGSTFSALADFCPDPGTTTASADTTADQGSPNANNGTATTTRVQSAATVVLFDNERTLVKFVLPSKPGYCDVTSATLRFTASSSSSGRTVEVRRVTGTWTEAGATWNTRPSTTDTDLTSAASGTGPRSWTVTNVVASMYAGTNNGFELRDSAERGLLGIFSSTQTYSSREGANPPTLDMTFG